MKRIITIITTTIILTAINNAMSFNPSTPPPSTSEQQSVKTYEIEQILHKLHLMNENLILLNTATKNMATFMISAFGENEYPEDGYTVTKPRKTAMKTLPILTEKRKLSPEEQRVIEIRLKKFIIMK